MEYRIVFEESDEGFAASVPELPGCHSQGKDKAEALANITDAIREYLEVRQKIEAGLRDAAEGRMVSHEEVFEEFEKNG
jgi:predicted RNase H-like HicB family nuclease